MLRGPGLSAYWLGTYPSGVRAVSDNEIFPVPEAWAKRAPNLVVKTPQEALTLASIVEKETGKADERSMLEAIRYATALARR